MKKKVTMKDIALAASVSETTVSLVINDRPSRISELKKAEIKQLALDMNYRPNYLARSLSTQKSHTIGLIIPDIENPYFSSLSKNVEDILRAKGYMVFTVNNDDRLKNDQLLVREFIDRQVDGIMIVPSNESYYKLEKTKKLLKSIQIPYVLVDRVFQGMELNQVSFDNELGGYLATQALIEQGCETIACITGSLQTNNGMNRFKGYKRALSESGLVFEESNVFEGDYRYETGYKFGQVILNQKKIDGVFACNDLMAFGVLRAMADQDVIQEDLKLVGYDDLKQADMFGVDLVSIAQDIELLSETASQLLLNQIADRNKIEQVIFKPRIN